MNEFYTKLASDHEKELEYIEANIDALVTKYLAMADSEYAKFRDDSNDSDVAGACWIKEMLVARDNYLLYTSIAREIAAILQKPHRRLPSSV